MISLLAFSFPDQSGDAGCWASLRVSRMFRGCRAVASNTSFLLLPLSLSRSVALLVQLLKKCQFSSSRNASSVPQETLVRYLRNAGSVPQEMLVQFLRNASSVPQEMLVQFIKKC